MSLCRGTQRSYDSICNLKYSVPKIIPIVSLNGSSYDYHFIIKELGEEFKIQISSSEENTEKSITFTVPVEKEVITIDKKEQKLQDIHLTLKITKKEARTSIYFLNSARSFVSNCPHFQAIVYTINLNKVTVIAVFELNC